MPSQSPASSPSSHDESDLLDALDSDNDPTLVPYRAQRLQQLSEELSRAKDLRKQGHGTYTEILDEGKLMETITGTKWCVVHFFKPDFARCGIMNGHLENLAPVHIDAMFLRINVENAPFLVAKLQVQVLPCVIAFVNGVSVGRIIGFEGLGHGTDTFTTKDLEKRLLNAGVLTNETVMQTCVQNVQSLGVHSKGNRPKEADDDGDDDSDWE